MYPKRKPPFHRRLSHFQYPKRGRSREDSGQINDETNLLAMTRQGLFGGASAPEGSGFERRERGLGRKVCAGLAGLQPRRAAASSGGNAAFRGTFAPEKHLFRPFSAPLPPLPRLTASGLPPQEYTFSAPLPPLRRPFAAPLPPLFRPFSAPRPRCHRSRQSVGRIPGASYAIDFGLDCPKRQKSGNLCSWKTSGKGGLTQHAKVPETVFGLAAEAPSQAPGYAAVKTGNHHRTRRRTRHDLKTQHPRRPTPRRPALAVHANHTSRGSHETLQNTATTLAHTLRTRPRTRPRPRPGRPIPPPSRPPQHH